MNWKERFSRHIKAGIKQALIRKYSCCVVGVGGLGTVVVQKLAFLGVKDLSLVDMDRVTESNLNRQFFYETDLGKFKVDATKEKILQLNSGVRILTYHDRVQNVLAALKNAEVIFDCLDNLETRSFLNQYCVKNKKVLIHGGCSDVNGEVMLYNPKLKLSCLDCLPYPATEEKRSCADFDAAICTTNGIVANLQVDAFINLTQKNNDWNWAFYTRQKGLTYKRILRNKNCKTCK